MADAATSAPISRKSLAVPVTSGPGGFATQSGPMLVIDGAIHPQLSSLIQPAEWRRSVEPDRGALRHHKGMGELSRVCLLLS